VVQPTEVARKPDASERRHRGWQVALCESPRGLIGLALRRIESVITPRRRDEARDAHDNHQGKDDHKPKTIKYPRRTGMAE
jgi:hypothetical protein